MRWCCCCASQLAPQVLYHACMSPGHRDPHTVSLPPAHRVRARDSVRSGHCFYSRYSHLHLSSLPWTSTYLLQTHHPASSTLLPSRPLHLPPLPSPPRPSSSTPLSSSCSGSSMRPSRGTSYSPPSTRHCATSPHLKTPSHPTFLLQQTTSRIRHYRPSRPPRRIALCRCLCWVPRRGRRGSWICRTSTRGMAGRKKRASMRAWRWANWGAG